MKLEVKHDVHTYNIPIDIIYKCLECLDRGVMWVGYDDNVQEIKCPFCNTPNETDDDS